MKKEPDTKKRNGIIIPSSFSSTKYFFKATRTLLTLDKWRNSSWHALCLPVCSFFDNLTANDSLAPVKLVLGGRAEWGIMPDIWEEKFISHYDLLHDEWAFRMPKDNSIYVLYWLDHPVEIKFSIYVYSMMTII